MYKYKLKRSVATNNYESSDKFKSIIIPTRSYKSPKEMKTLSNN